jgi:hypothetical protein
LPRAFRLALYEHSLRAARGEGLCPRRGFRGLHAEVGANPPIGELETALKTRVDELPREPEQGDPFEGADEYQLDRRRVVRPFA